MRCEPHQRFRGEPTPEYWDALANAWRAQHDPPVWRMVSDAVNARLLRRWLPASGGGPVLKTDLFDEVAGTGLVPLLMESFGHVAAVDISPALVAMARARCPGLQAQVADVRQLPFADGAFDHVLSNSTLDHFPARADLERALREIHRVTRVGGTLMVTLDNPVHPVVAIRNALPARLRAATGMAPFAVGVTCGPGQLRQLLTAIGYDVVDTSAIFHAPRVLVVAAGYLLDRYARPSARQRWVAACLAFEGLAQWPTRYVTGHFVGALARKR